MILAFPYHDPAGDCNAALRRHLDPLRSFFDAICLGATPPTVAQNATFLAELRAAGCHVVENAPQTSIGDHSRSALRLAVGLTGQSAPLDGDPRPIAFLFLDRFLFALETEHKELFLADLARYSHERCLVFERTPAAWATHPANYQEVEGMTTRLGELMYGTRVDWCPCALILGASIARGIVQQSRNHTYAVWAEFMLLAAKQGAPISSTAVDWLAWETPFWEHADPVTLKQAQESNPLEIVKRIQMHAPIALLMAEQRFRDTQVRTQTARPMVFGEA